MSAVRLWSAFTRLTPVGSVWPAADNTLSGSTMRTRGSAATRRAAWGDMRAVYTTQGVVGLEDGRQPKRRP